MLKISNVSTGYGDLKVLFNIDLEIKEGEGLLLQYGNVIEITWTCNEGEGFVFLDAATGEEVKLIPGKTIINIADPTSEPAEYEEGAE